MKIQRFFINSFFIYFLIINFSLTNLIFTNTLNAQSFGNTENSIYMENVFKQVLENPKPWWQNVISLPSNSYNTLKGKISGIFFGAKMENNIINNQNINGNSSENSIQNNNFLENFNNARKNINSNNVDTNIKNLGTNIQGKPIVDLDKITKENDKVKFVTNKQEVKCFRVSNTCEDLVVEIFFDKDVKVLDQSIFNVTGYTIKKIERTAPKRHLAILKINPDADKEFVDITINYENRDYVLSIKLVFDKDKNGDISSSAATPTSLTASEIAKAAEQQRVEDSRKQQEITSAGNGSEPHLMQASPYLGENTPTGTGTGFNNGGSWNSNGGYSDANYTPVNPKDYEGYPALGNSNADCGNNGLTKGGSGLQSKLLSDSAFLCKLFGKKLSFADGKRSGPCGSPGARHNCGEALDFNVEYVGDKKRQALLVLGFMSLGYNVASYEGNFPLHADFYNYQSCGGVRPPNGSCWGSWSRWAHTNGKAKLPYHPAIKDALILIGLPANSAQEFHSSYAGKGISSKSNIQAKAKQFLQNLNKSPTQ
jgi:hypothetical protein